MVNFSAEQKEIIKTVLSKKNCLVDAVAGSGKTTTVLGIAQGDPTKRIIQITYNRHLKEEVKEKVVAQKITNMEVYTYHGLCVRYYHRKAFTDTQMKSVLHKQSKLLQKIPDFDTLVIDEAQDMNLLFFQFVRKFLHDYGKPVTIVLLGDENQSINEFRGADRRFLTFGSEIYKAHGEFTRLTLKTSYRLTNQIATFINRNMLGEDRINTVRDGPKVEFMRTNAWQPDKVLKRLMGLLDSKEIKPGDIFVLSATTRSKRDSELPINKLENALVDKKVPCFFPNDDEEELNSDVTDGKVVFSTIHQSKGRERPVVVVYGFDSNWFTFFGRDLNRNVCPPELYVAASRASKLLILLEGNNSAPLEFLKERPGFSSLSYLAYSSTDGSIPKPNKSEKAKNTNPTDMLRYMNEEVMYALLQIKDQIFTKYTPARKSVAIDSVAKNTIGTVENISDLNGLCIPALWEETVRGTSDIKEFVRREIRDSMKHADILKRAYRSINMEATSLNDYLRLTNIYQAINTNCHCKIAQIESYNWLTQEAVDECHASMSKYIDIDKNPVFEYPITDVKYVLKDFGEIILNCRLDAVDDTAVWEFKCVADLQLEHFLQLIIYAWMWKEAEYETNGSRKFFLMNIRTEEIHELDTTSPYIDEVVEILLENKFKLKEKISKEIFLQRCSEQIHTAVIQNIEKEGESLELKTIADLVALCKTYGLRNITKCSKAELIAKIDSFKKNGPSLEDKNLQELHALCAAKSIIGVKKKSRLELIELLKTAPKQPSIATFFQSKQPIQTT